MSLARSAAAVAVHAYTASGALLRVARAAERLGARPAHGPAVARASRSSSMPPTGTPRAPWTCVAMPRGSTAPASTTSSTTSPTSSSRSSSSGSSSASVACRALGCRGGGAHRQRTRVREPVGQDGGSLLHGVAVLLEPRRGVRAGLAVVAGDDHGAAAGAGGARLRAPEVRLSVADDRVDASHDRAWA